MYNRQKHFHKSNVIIHKNNKSNNQINSIKEPIDYNTCDFNLTPLFLSLNNSDEEECIKLINNGCRINYENNFEDTPIGLALLLKLYKVVNLLLSKDEFIDYNNKDTLNKFFNESRNIDFNVFIDNLFKHNIPLNEDIINICIKSPSLINFKQFMDKLYDYNHVINNNFIKSYINNKNYNVLLSLYNYENNGNKFKLEYDDTVLKHMLSYTNEINDIFEILVKTDFKPETKKYDSYQNSLLCSVINCSYDDKLFNIIKFLLDNDIFINYDLKIGEIKEGYPKSLIYQKLMNNQYNGVNSLYNTNDIIQLPKSGFNVVGFDPLIDSIRYKNKEITKLLLDNNIKLNNCYYSAVFYAIEFSYEDIFEELIKKGANISGDLEEIQYSYIFHALINHKYKYALKLLQNGAKYDYDFNNFDNSLLYYAIQLNINQFYCKDAKQFGCKINCHKCDLKEQIGEHHEIIRFLLMNDTRYTTEMINEFYNKYGKGFIIDIEDLI